jgi:hypothetical protein
MQTAAEDSRSERQYENLFLAVLDCDRIAGLTKLVVLSLVGHWPHKSPPLGKLASICGISVRTVRDCLRDAEQKQVISRVPVPGSASTYNFPGVSIPRLGVSPPPGGTPANYGRGTPAPFAGVTPAPFAAPPSPSLPPPPLDKNGDAVSLEFKISEGEGSARARGTPRPRDLSSTKKIDTPRCDCCDGRQGLEHPLVGWVMPAALHAELVSLRLTPARIEFRMGNLLNIERAGEGRRCLSVYVREQADKWVRWDGAEGLLTPDAVSCAGTAPRIDFPPEVLKRVQGMVPGAAALALAAEYGLDIVEQYSRFVLAGKARELGLTATYQQDHARPRVQRAFLESLQHLAAQRRDGAAA